MADAILVPAWPALLRAGLPVVLVSGERGPFVAWLDHMQQSALVAIEQDDALTEVRVSVRRPNTLTIRLDLRDPAVRDAVVRAIWRKLRPDEPEPLTAPIFDCETRPDELPSEDEDPPCWWLAHPLAPDNGVAFGCLIESKDGVYRKVSALNDVDFASPDRDLLALAEVAKAVLA